ncbi:MAG: hypothetical protein QOH15_115 [Gaiellales bacterium]|nr:hypothetical protein [Gaiellales bacterium]
MSTNPPKNISGGGAPAPTTLTWSDAINKRVRGGDWSDQAISTTRKIVEAIERGHWEVAAQLIDYWMEEAKVVYVIYAVWDEGFASFLTHKGVPEPEIAGEIARVRELLAFPDGSPFEAKAHWDALAVGAGLLANRLRAFEITAEAARAALDELREAWRQLHDRGADFQAGMLTFVARRFGEAAIEEAFSFVLDPYLQERYRPFDIRETPYDETLFRNLYLSFEAMRGHLVGPDRTGDMEVDEHEDRYVISFDPCGSGGRQQRGDPIEGTGSRAEAPYDFGVTREEHDWAWNEKGVCYYCAHCCFALEHWPARQWGHPLRVIDSPLYPAETSGPEPKKCTWTIFKTIEAIPAEAYERIGLEKPSR